jgi:hypothetical protein
MVNTKIENWEKSNLQVFWGEIAPCEHVVQIYENDKVFLDTLEGFIGSGIIAGDGIIIIATAEHLFAIENRLRRQDFDIDALSASGRYIGLDAAETLSKFMINDWPDEHLFRELITALFKKLHQHNRKVRAFGEMVAILWEQGFNGATVKLENMWNKLHTKEDFTLFCAYPKIGLTRDMNASIDIICSEHSKLIDGQPRPSTEIRYKAI